MASFGGSVKLQGESEYKAALRAITQNLKEVSSEMKLVTSAYTNNGTSVAALTEKQRVLTQQLNTQQDKVKLLKSQYDKMVETYAENAEKHEKLVKEYETEKAKLSEIEKTLGTSSAEYKKQAEEVENLEGKVNKSTTSQEKAGVAMSKMRTEINNAQAAANTTAAAVDKMGEDIKNAGEETEEAGQKAEKASGGFTIFKGALANLVSGVISNALNAMKNLASETIETGANFEAAMSKVGAVSGATGDEMEALNAKAKEMGATTKFSATESAEAFNYMAMAGWKTDDMLNGISGVMNLAAASGADLAITSDIVTDALTGFGKSAEDAGQLADIMAAASSNANTNVELMGETFKYVTPVAGAMGYSMEDTALSIGLMANAGIKGSQAGTSLRSMLTRLASPPKECAEAMEALGISITDTDGNMKPFREVLGDLRERFSGLSEAEQTQNAKAIAGAEAMSGLLAIVNASPADVDKLTDAIDNSAGSAEKMATVMGDNLSGDLTLTKSHLEGVQIALYEKFEPSLRAGVEVLNKLLDGLQFVVDHSTEFTTGVVAMGTAVGAYVAYTTALKVMQEGWTALTVVTKAQEIAQAALNAVMSANPIGIVIAGITALIAAVMYLWNTNEDFRNFVTGIFEDIKAKFSVVVEFFKGSIEAIENFFGGLGEGIGKFKDGAVEKFEGLRSGATDKFNAIKDTMTGAMTKAKDGVKDELDRIKSAYDENGGGIKGTVAAMCTGVKDYYSGLYNALNNMTGGRLGDMLGVIGDKMQGVKDTFTNAFNAVKDTVEGALDRVKGFFNGLSLKLPHIDLPHFKIDGGFSLTPPSVPHFAVEWYSKAMPEGMILNNPTIFGMGGGNLLGGGEAGQEAVVGVTSLSSMIRQATTNAVNGIMGAWLNTVTATISENVGAPLTELSAAVRSIDTGDSAEYSYNKVVEAFKDALEEMKITLDDDELGHFVRKTVTDAIYT